MKAQEFITKHQAEDNCTIARMLNKMQRTSDCELTGSCTARWTFPDGSAVEMTDGTLTTTEKQA